MPTEQTHNKTEQTLMGRVTILWPCQTYLHGIIWMQCVTARFIVMWSELESSGCDERMKVVSPYFVKRAYTVCFQF